MAAQAMKAQRIGMFAVLLLVLLLLASLHMMSEAVQRSDVLDTWFIPLLLFTVTGLALLVLVVGWSLWRLLRDYRRHISGSHLNLRLVALFVGLSLAPVSVVYLYSLQFLAKGIDGWFDVQVDSAMEDALSLSKVSLDLHKRERLTLTQSLLNSQEDSSVTALMLNLSELRESSGAIEISLLDMQGKGVAVSHQNPEVLVPTPPTEHMMQQISMRKSFVSLVPTLSNQLVVRCLAPDTKSRGLILQAIYPVSESLSGLTTQVQSAYEAYRERAYLRDSIKFSFAFTLSLVLMLGLFAAFWAAFYTSRQLVKPIRDISEGTRAVAQGNYDKQLPLPAAKDELGFLVDSFNEMMRRISQARNQADASRRELQAQHKYLETVLGALSSGVMALDRLEIIQTANPAAEKILQLPIKDYQGRALKSLMENAPYLSPFVKCFDTESGGLLEEQAEVTLRRANGRQILLCQRSSLPSPDIGIVGHVLVFDDVTELVSAQRDAAWGEVARRLAHEIKNPLTPIQLAAERVRRKYLGHMSSEQADVLDRATHTIIQQVEALKMMVNEFSDYARPCRLASKPVLLDKFIREVFDLYEGSNNRIDYRPDAAGVQVELDPVRMRQVLHNLIKNAQEALSGRQGRICLSTRLVRHQTRQKAQIQLVDDGMGFDPELLDRAFEPYMTTKSKGTGLGLAIVKRIISEHGGSVYAENRADGRGAKIVVLLTVHAIIKLAG